MTLEQQILGQVPDLQSRGQDEITWLPGLLEAFPPEATRKHLSYPQVGVLGLQPIIIREDMSQWALLGCFHHGATLPCVTDQEIELPLIYDQPPCQPFSVSHAALGKFSDIEQASSLPSGNQTSFCLPKEIIASLSSASQIPQGTPRAASGPNRHLQNAFKTRQG